MPKKKRKKSTHKSKPSSKKRDLFLENEIKRIAKEVKSKKPEAPKASKDPQNTKSVEKNTSQRNPAVVLILCLFTFGLYLLYWLISTTKLLRRTTKSAPNPLLLILLLIPIINITIVIVYFWKFSESLNELTGSNKASMFILWILFPPVAAFIAQKKINEKGKKSPGPIENPPKITEKPKQTNANLPKSSKHSKNILKKAKKKRITAKERKLRLKNFIERAGLELNLKKLVKKFFNLAVYFCLLVSLHYLYKFSTNFGYGWGAIITTFVTIWTFGLFFVYFGIWLCFYSYVDVRIYRRKLELEEVLPDFLQLTASNISAGMPIDRALYFAVRPRFGVLAKEIENIAKETVGGADLRIALEKFASRYDSIILKRSISLLNEGIEAGGEIGTLLNRIATDIQDQKAMLKDMAANVTTYVIFITFASIIAAPFLFALSGALIVVVGTIGASLGNSAVQTNAVIPISFGQGGITESDFKIFAVVSLALSSSFSAMLISTIKRGNIKSGLKTIPIFMFIAITLYFIVQTFSVKFIGIFF